MSHFRSIGVENRDVVYFVEHRLRSHPQWIALQDNGPLRLEFLYPVRSGYRRHGRGEALAIELFDPSLQRMMPEVVGSVDSHSGMYEFFQAMTPEWVPVTSTLSSFSQSTR